MDFLLQFCRSKLFPNRFVTGKKIQTIVSSSRASLTRSTTSKRCTRICESQSKLFSFPWIVKLPLPNASTSRASVAIKYHEFCRSLTRDQISFSCFHFAQWKVILRSSLFGQRWTKKKRHKLKLQLLSNLFRYKSTMRLNITRMRPQDYGEYHCVSKNEMGIARAVFHLQGNEFPFSLLTFRLTMTWTFLDR